ncbi:Uma2 family endonuclease, partial [Streptomyces alkaliphilus]|uniref:Uma2 family endonuclease n=1 Tax=Streptomyces alkaliphilus TaxID=1472722 RepID=UPI001E51BF67
PRNAPYPSIPVKRVPSMHPTPRMTAALHALARRHGFLVRDRAWEETMAAMATAEPPRHDPECTDLISTVIGQVMRLGGIDTDVAVHREVLLRCRPGAPGVRTVPDAVFSARELRLFRGAPPWLEGREVLMVVDTAVPGDEEERSLRRRAYAEAGIPLHLLIERERAMVSLFSRPSAPTAGPGAPGRAYTRLHTVPTGRPLPLPAPFGFDLDTGDLA